SARRYAAVEARALLARVMVMGTVAGIVVVTVGATIRLHLRLQLPTIPLIPVIPIIVMMLVLVMVLMLIAGEGPSGRKQDGSEDYQKETNSFHK
ncbi:MAG: hypothetical protein ABJF10_20115, partial [Chthoniobacter sp.]|uniref:hypothetical protein n=1 Tax=Chthoniobacter sp. TaxID=2510640 RepID=UPI0032A82465